MSFYFLTPILVQLYGNLPCATSARIGFYYLEVSRKFAHRYTPPMKTIVLFIALCAIGLSGMAQSPEVQKLQLIKTSEYLEAPGNLIGSLEHLKERDSVVLITFAKRNGTLLEHGAVTKKKLLEELGTTHFIHRYFVVLIGTKAIFYIK